MFNNAQDSWYAIFVLTGEEDKVKERLKYRFKDKLRILVPKRRIKERKNGEWHHNIKTLFPGYVLVNGSVSQEDYCNLQGVPGLIKMLRSGHTPLEIDSYEMEILNRLICNNETIGFSNILVENKKIVVVDGPLLSLEGQIESIDYRKGRAKVRLDFLGEARTVDLGISVLQPA